MSFVEKNEENLDSLVFALTERSKTAIVVGIYDTEDTRSKAINHVNLAFNGQKILSFDFFGQKVESLLAFFRENLPDSDGDKLPLVHLIRLDPQLFVAVNHKVVSAPLVAQINMEREMLFQETKALVIIWLTRDGYNRLRMDAPDFMDWVSSFVFVGDEVEPQPELSFFIPKQTAEDRNKATLLALRQKAEALQQRTVKFEQRQKLSTKDAKEYFNLLLALIAALRDLQDLTQAQIFLQRAFKLVENYQISTSFEAGSLLINWGDTETALGNIDKALPLYQRALQYFHESQNLDNLAVAFQRLGETYKTLGDLSRALEVFKAYSTLAKSLSELLPDDMDLRSRLAFSYARLGDTYRAMENLSQALIYLKQSNALEKSLHELHPENLNFKHRLAISYSELGVTYRAMGDLVQALIYFDQSNELMEALHNLDSENIQFKDSLGVNFTRLGITHREIRSLQQALLFLEKSLNLNIELHELYPENIRFKDSLATSYAQMGLVHKDKNNPAQARSYLQQAEKIWTELAKDAPSYAEFQRNLIITREKLADLP